MRNYAVFKKIRIFWLCGQKYLRKAKTILPAVEFYYINWFKQWFSCLNTKTIRKVNFSNVPCSKLINVHICKCFLRSKRLTPSKGISARIISVQFAATTYCQRISSNGKITKNYTTVAQLVTKYVHLVLSHSNFILWHSD